MKEQTGSTEAAEQSRESQHGERAAALARPYVPSETSISHEASRGKSTAEASGKSDTPSEPSALNLGSGAQHDSPGGEHRIRPDLRQDEVLTGGHPGDRYIRQRRQVGAFRRKGSGVLAASLAADQPRSRWGRR
ncbi:MAG TPA: hypothetical protein VM409_06615, partial [Chloroflexia bacterium]|nr:hypothetical protein [Chloroflexia bacterium]